MVKICSHSDLVVFQKAFGAAMEIFEFTKGFPVVESYSLIDQIRRSSRSVAANLAEAFKRRVYPRMFISKLTDCESEAAETQVWLAFSLECHYLDKASVHRLTTEYDQILNMIHAMKLHPEKWQPF